MHANKMANSKAKERKKEKENHYIALLAMLTCEVQWCSECVLEADPLDDALQARATHVLHTCGKVKHKDEFSVRNSYKKVKYTSLNKY